MHKCTPSCPINAESQQQFDRLKYSLVNNLRSVMRVASPYGDAPGEHESECVELMRKIRIMEGKRTTSHADEQRVISAQRSTIDKLRKSNKALQEDIHQDSKVASLEPAYQNMAVW